MLCKLSSVEKECKLKYYMNIFPSHFLDTLEALSQHLGKVSDDQSLINKRNMFCK